MYQGQVDDPFYTSGVKYHRMKHATQNRWIWYRVTDRALVYEQYYDGTSNSWIKYFEGGITENKFLFSSDFRIGKCSNPFVALPATQAPISSFFEAAEPVVLAKKDDDIEDEFVRWVMKEYDTDKDGELDMLESAKLVDDLQNWDIGKESVKISDISEWIAQFDKNGDKKLSIDELIKALS